MMDNLIKTLFITQFKHKIHPMKEFQILKKFILVLILGTQHQQVFHLKKKMEQQLQIIQILILQKMK